MRGTDANDDDVEENIYASVCVCLHVCERVGEGGRRGQEGGWFGYSAKTDSRPAQAAAHTCVM